MLDAESIACAADVNGDAVTDTADFMIIASNLGELVPQGTAGDLNDDGVVSIFDVNLLAADFGCGT